ncbi:zinc transporter 5 [Panicum miliaceum]|uniref:Zinc transporter 5 n=1 Tax=Panicum miliaceum TaxID=4540 RepID=A0A3L6SPX3_PANMI|nr:zinc transporter 5 [Panicum miliaceum]
MVLMAAVDDDHHRGARFAPPPPSPLAPAPRAQPPPPSSRTRLHDFSFPTLSWGTHRLLRCSKSGPASSSPPTAPETPYPDKEKTRRPDGGGGATGAGGSLQRPRAARRPWNLRTRRSATADPARPAGSGEAAEEAVPVERAPAPAAEAKKRVFSIALSKEEIAEDFAAIRGSRPPRRPKKRPRTVQRQLDLLYPGLCLADVTPGSYKIEEVVPTVVNGGILALYFVLWGKGLLACGPLIALLAEYAGAVLGVLSAALYGRKVNIWKKANSFGSEPLEKATQTIGMKEMVVPITAGILSALRRVLARRVSLKNQLKRRLHAITIASATCFLFPFAMWDTILGSASDSIVKLQLPSWAYLSTVVFGMVLIFYVDNVAEEKLHLVFSSPRHLMVSTGCIIVLEIFYKMDFSLLGFLVCSVILGFGIFEATSLERPKKSPLEAHELSNGVFHNQLPISALPS